MRTRLLALGALLFATACSDLVVGNAPKSDNVAVFDAMWNEVDLRYPFLDYKGIDWTAVGNKYRPLAAAAKNDTALAVVIGNALAELKDVHVTFTPFGDASMQRYIAPLERKSTYFDSTVTYRQLTQVRSTSGRHITYGMAGAGIGYVRIATFTGGEWADEIDEALKSMPNVRTLMIDVRDNHGGSRPLAIAVAGRFTSDAHTFSYLRFRAGPSHEAFTADIAQMLSPAGANHFSGAVQVLANRHTMSAGEDFVLAMRSLPNVAVLGDTTAGATGGPMPRELPNGWTYTLSEWIQYTTQHQAFEGLGLAPDIAVLPTTADALAKRDPAFTRALLRAETLQ